MSDWLSRPVDFDFVVIVLMALAIMLILSGRRP